MSDPTSRGRQTRYNGIDMRSRLEADVAAYLDASPSVVEWSYEPKCYANETGQYLPDFSILYSDGIRRYWEVKPESYPLDKVDDLLGRISIIWSSEPDARLMLILWEYGHGRPRLVLSAHGSSDQWWLMTPELAEHHIMFPWASRSQIGSW